jgi:ribosome-associated translation inhibitor RaiA
MSRSENIRDGDEGQKLEERLGRTTRFMQEVKQIDVTLKKENIKLVKDDADLS